MRSRIAVPAVRGQGSDYVRGKDRRVERSIGVMGPKRLIDQALATMVAAESLGPRDQISLTNEQALVWAIYLRVVERQRGLASGQELEHSVRAARDGGISAEEIEAAIAAGDRPEAREEK